MEDKEKTQKLNTIDLSVFSKKRSKNLKILHLQFEFNADWRCILEFLKENNFDVEIDSKYILNSNQYEFIKLNFNNNNCKLKTIKRLDIQAAISNTSVPVILEYFKKSNIKYQLSENGNDIINLDFKTWYILVDIIDAIETVPIENIQKYIKENIVVDFMDKKNDFDDDFDNYNSNYIERNNSLAKGLYNIAMGNLFESKWYCDLCDGDSQTGCLLSDKTRCIK
jgi:hypothetical protein